MFQMWFKRSWSWSWPSGLEFLTLFSALTQNRKPYPDRAFLFIELNFLANFLQSTRSSLIISKQYANHQMEVRGGGSTDLFAPNITQAQSRRQTTGTEFGLRTQPGKYSMFLQVGKPSGSSLYFLSFSHFFWLGSHHSALTLAKFTFASYRVDNGWLVRLVRC